jgi:glycine/D-amino acid oxidase-like deaminating enzyme
LRSDKADIIIIGGGVLGISLAYHLTKINLNCIILEKENLICQHSSAKNAGMIRQLYREEILTNWAERSINNWPKQIKNAFFKQTGSIIIDRNLPGHHEHLFSKGEILDSGSVISYIHTATDGLLDPESYVNALKAEALLSNKLKIITNFKVSSFSEISSGYFEVSSISNEKVYGSKIVNASGAWLNSVFNSKKEFEVPAKPFARHLFVSSGWESELEKRSTLPEHGFYWDERSGWYRRNWSKEENLVSACDTNPAEPDNYIPQHDPETRIATKILESLPSSGENIRIGRGWHCFRTYTEDSLPIMGFDKLIKNFYWLAAFGGFGMSTSFAATEDAANEIIGKKSFINEKVQVNRFR